MLKIFRNKYAEDEKGAVAVEAALLSTAFFGLLVFSFELLVTLYFTVKFDHAITEAIDDIRFGGATAAATAENLSAEQFYRRSICKHLEIEGCENNIQVDLTLFNAEGNAVQNSSNVFVNASTMIVIDASIDAPLSLFLSHEGSPVRLKTSQFFMTEPF